MFTRSQQNIEKYAVDIDFNEASAAWRENKKSMPNGMFKYICGCPTKSGKKCIRTPKTGHKFCVFHIKKEIKEENNK
jgi:hypothetical protein